MTRLSLPISLRRVYLLLGMVLVCSHMWAQNNPSFLDIDVKQGTTYAFNIESTSKPIAKVNIEIPDWGNVEVNVDDGTGNYLIEYTAPSGYEGHIEFLIQYTGIIPFPISSYTKFTKIIANVGPSVISPVDDIIIYNGEPTINIQPSLNDEYSDGPIDLINLAHVQQGSAIILDPMTISYTAPQDFQGRDIINYVVQDTLGNKGNGIIYIVSESTINASDTIYLVVSSEYKRYLFMPTHGMELQSQNGNKGNLTNLNSLAFVYSPIAGKKGNDVLVFGGENGYTRTIVIDVVDNAPGNTLVTNDNVYTSVGTQVQFNVSKNDFISSNNIVYYSPELTNLGNGNFSFIPDAGFVGFKEYKYKVNTGSEIVTGAIKIKIDNYYPAPIIYAFDIPKGNPLVLDYEVPIAGYEFNVLSPANNGDVEYFASGTNISLDCGETGGKAMVLYSPNAGFVGLDEFDLEYCIDGSQCKVIKVQVNVHEDTGEDCGCVSNCIWPGDANANGIVELSDILAVGYHMGETGPERNDIDFGTWHSQSGEEWLSDQAIGPNLKHIDGDGNGLIENEDMQAIWENLGKYHSIIPSSVLLLKKAPIVLIPRNTQVEAGDLMIMDIALGNESFPVLDMHGISFQLKINPRIIDSSSVTCHFYDDSWMADGFGVIQGFAQPEDGIINSVITRTTGLPLSGSGIIGTTTFIVEDELDGFRPSEKIDELPFDIEVSEILAYDSNGETYTLPSSSTSVTLELDQSEKTINPELSQETIDEKLMIFPNPVKDELYVHLNGKKDITSIKIYDLLGRTMHSENNMALEGISIDVSRYNEGIYFLEVGNGEEISTQKFKVSR